MCFCILAWGVPAVRLMINFQFSLVVGPRYQVEDFSLNGIDILAWKASGIQCKHCVYNLKNIGH